MLRAVSVVPASTSGVAGVATWNNRSGTVVMSQGDVTNVLPGSSTPPIMDGVQTVGTLNTWAHGDHIHPSDTSRLPIAGGTLTGPLTLAADPASALQPVTLQYFNSHLPVAPTTLPPSGPASGDLTGTYPGPTLLTTVNGNVGTFNYATLTVNAKGLVTAASSGAAPPAPATVPPLIDATTAAVGTSLLYARQDHVHPSDVVTAQAAQDNVGRNLLANPVYTVQQRGTGPWTVSGNYTADRWGLTITNDTVSASIQALADSDRTAIGDEAAQYALQDVFTGSATAGSQNSVFQRIESVRRLSGKQLTVSFWARATSGTPRIAVTLGQNFGSGGSPSATTTTAFGTTPALSAAWTRYTASGSAPSVAGKVFGTTAGTDFSGLFLGLSDTSNTVYNGGIGQQSGTVQLWGVQLELGSVATALDKGGSPQAQLAECQRFYQQGSVKLNLGYSSAGWTSMITQQLPVTMRASPTCAVLGTPNYTNASGATVSAWQAGGIQFGATATAAGGMETDFTFSASADL